MTFNLLLVYRIVAVVVFLLFLLALEWNKQRKEILEIRQILEKLADIDEKQGKVEGKQREAIYTTGLGLDLLLEKLGYKIVETPDKKYKITKTK